MRGASHFAHELPTFSPMRVILFHKPYGVLSQFSREGKWETLASFGPFPAHVYAAGRLDAESEGLLVLTDDNRIKQRLTEPRFGHPRTYLAQVERVPVEASLERLRRGVRVGGSQTLPAMVRLLENEPEVTERPVPIRVRKSVPTAWLELTLTEGKNRQVRKMTASVGHPTLRLIRIRVGDLTLEGIPPGRWREATDAEVAGLATLPGRRPGARASSAEPGRSARAGPGATRRGKV